MKNCDYMAVGLTTLDILGRNIEEIPKTNTTTIIKQIEVIPAGTAAGAAMIAATLGMKSALISTVGKDRQGRFVTQELEAVGVDTTLVDQHDQFPTSQTILTIDKNGQRPNFHALGASVFTQLSDHCFSKLENVKYLHWAAVGSAMLKGAASRDFLAKAKEAGVITTCDLIVADKTVIKELKNILPFIDYFLPSMEEALSLTGTDNPKDAANALMEMGAKVCLIKWGSKGVYIATPEQHELIPAFEVKVEDTTSCGDSFCAGFVTGLSKGMDIREACRFGCAVASLVAQGLGTIGKLQSYEQALEQVETCPRKKCEAV